MLILIKKYPAEAMGILFALIFGVLGGVSLIIPPVENIVEIPLSLAISVFMILLFGLITIYLYANWDQVHSWRKGAELFIMLAAICSSLSDAFWIFSAVASVIIIIGCILEKKLSINNPIILGWGAVVLVSLISSCFALESKILSFGSSLGIILYSLYFIAVYNQNFLLERGEEFLQRIGVLLSFSIITTVIFSLWHYNIPYHIYVLIFDFQPQTGTDSFGIASIYGEWPTHSSAFLSIAFWALIGIRTFCSLSPIRKIILNMGILFALLGSLATLSRNAFLFLVLSVGICLLILIIKTKSKKLILLSIGIGIGFSSILGYLVTHFQKWKELFTNPLKQSTIADRLAQYQFGLEQIQTIDNPWTGIGLMNFGPYYRRMLNNEQLAAYLHQLFLSITLEIGYVGLVLFLILLFLIGREIIINYKKNDRYMIFVIVFFAWLATGVFDNWLYFTWSSTLFMVLIALGSKHMEQEN